MVNMDPDQWRAYVGAHVEEYLATNGEKGAIFNGIPCVILTTVGAKSGETRLSPVVRVPVPDSEDYVVVASMGGAPKHPSWYFNIKANPTKVTLQDRAVKRSYEARITQGEEREQLWKVAVDAYDSYAEYQTRTTREIPVIRLIPTDAAGGESA